MFDIETMRSLFLLVLALLTGCQSVRGPFAPKVPARVDDPRLSIGEQQKLGRDRLALPDNSAAVAPTEAGARPGR